MLGNVSVSRPLSKTFFLIVVVTEEGACTLPVKCVASAIKRLQSITID